MYIVSEHPHCLQCGARVPNFNGMHINIPAEVPAYDVVILSITLRIRCRCGAEWDLAKKAK